MRKILLLLTLLAPLIAKAQFTIVDSQDKEPLQGVYVFDSKGSLIDISNNEGVVTKATGTVMLSMLSYDALTIDVSTVKGGIVELTPQPIKLNEVVVQKTEFTKTSGTFRDIVVNSGKVVMYREGMMDFYYDKKNKKYTRRIRACRQYEHPNLRKLSYVDSLYMDVCRTFDLGKVSHLDSEGGEQHGDTLLVYAKKMKGKDLVKDGVMMFMQNGKLRNIIDVLKLSNKNSISILGIKDTYKKVINDWTYNVDEDKDLSLYALRITKIMDHQFGKKSPVITVETTQDFVVNDVTYLTRDQAKAEMKEKETESEFFTIPNCLPTLPKVLTDQIPTMKRTKRRDM